LGSVGRITEKVRDMMKQHFTILPALRPEKECYFVRPTNVSIPGAAPAAILIKENMHAVSRDGR
jgi:hypothetical protein